MKSKCDVIMRLFQEETKQSDIARSLNLSKQPTSKATKLYQETGNNNEHQEEAKRRLPTLQPIEEEPRAEFK